MFGEKETGLEPVSPDQAQAMRKEVNMAKTVNYGDAYTHRITLRLNDSQYMFLIGLAKILDTTPSNYLRMSINAMMSTSAQDVEKVMKGQVGTHENVKTDFDNKL